MLDDHTADLTVTEDVGDLLGREHEIYRHENDSGTSSGECQHGILPAVASQQSDPITRSKPVVPQRRRSPIHQFVELSERQPDSAVNDCDLVGTTAGRPAGDVAQ